MTFSSFLFGIIVLYAIYYGCVIFFDMRKKTQKKDSEDYSDIGIDTEEFKAIDASSVYSMSESSVEESPEASSESSVEESPKESSDKESAVVPVSEDAKKVPEETSEENVEEVPEETEAPEVGSEEEFAKHCCSITNHGGIEVYDAKKMIREMGENPFSDTANEYLKFV